MKIKKLDIVRASHPREAEFDVAARFIGDLGRGRKRNVSTTLRRHRQYARTLRPILEGALLFDWAYRRVKSQDPDFKLSAKSGIAHKSKL
jgi:hypothetical protein